MRITEDDFRALARSSPWLWRTVRFTYAGDGRGRYPRPDEHVRAFVRRPNGVRIEHLDGTLVTAGWEAQGVAAAAMATAVFTGGAEPDLVVEADPAPAGPIRRPDGLVADRNAWPYEYDDPFYADYRWMAMLHPFELADGVTRDEAGEVDDSWSPLRPPIEIVDGPRVVDHHGRPAWEAELTTTGAYAARCSCCPLLSGAESARQLALEGWPPQVGVWPDSWRVRLDRQTGIVVGLTELGGDLRTGGWDVTIEAVDVDLSRGLFG